ncbi:serine hydrolase domain-containing protein [Glycomyces harbinensis]|uniref:CubicO group peptidase, beta-lactamase class C family n=1 Tax=Glycomyces harbinensis TaxID=58114 RepID=A0A1G7DG16_9ACTN|nr:serine hydrolase domain-containing protein [Glycomyces harbinensis]SDE49745.1 CubicO group peptidase, beta-lactamase class C family [Glycomyces harbinensis]
MQNGELDAIASWLDEALPSLVAAQRVPGAVVGVLQGERLVTATAGVLNRRTRQAVTADALFQVGSITKAWTATLVMQLVDEGLVELDDPVRRHLPEFRVADEASSAAITLRQLLSHTAGFDGDHFDEAAGDHVLDHYLRDVLPGAPRLFAPGRMFSYCNGGYSVLGRVLERLRGRRYAQVVQQYLAEPLGLGSVAASAEEAIAMPVAVGHIGTDLTPSRRWSVPANFDPAGCLAMPVGDLLRFARMHLDEGVAAGGTRILSADACAEMRTAQTQEPPAVTAFAAPSLGWFLLRGNGVVAADGGTIGQRAFLRLIPERGVAVALLANAGTGEGLLRPVLGEVLSRLGAAHRQTSGPFPAPQALEPSRMAGRYESSAGRFIVETVDERLVLRSEPGAFDVICDMAPPSGTLTAARGGIDITDSSGAVVGQCVFIMDGDRADLLHVNGQAVPRVE